MFGVLASSSADDGAVILGVLFLFGIILYFIPSVVGFANGHPHAIGIALANVLFGWTFVVWVIALIWACHKPTPPVIIQQAYPNPVPLPPALPIPKKLSLEDELMTLESLKTRQLVTEDEYQLRRQKLLTTIS